VVVPLGSAGECLPADRRAPLRSRLAIFVPQPRAVTRLNPSFENCIASTSIYAMYGSVFR
jgi:hypothetical protein